MTQKKDIQERTKISKKKPSNEDFGAGLVLGEQTECQKLRDESDITESNYREILNSTNEAIFIIDAGTGLITNVNESMLLLFGYDSNEEVFKGNIGDLSANTGSFTEKVAQAHVKNAIYEGPQVFDWLAKKKNGESFWVEVSLKKAEIGGKGRVVAVVRDITARKHAEEELLKSHETQQMLRTILDTIQVRVFWKDRNSVYLGCNKPFAIDAGYNDPNEIIGKTDFDTCWSAQAKLYRADDLKVIENNQAKLNFEEPQTSPDGSIIFIRTNKTPLVNTDGEVIGILGTFEDITEKKLTDELIRSNEIRYRSLIENAPDSIVLLNEDSRFTYVSPSVTRTLGYTIDDAKDLHPDDITHPDDLPAVHTAMGELLTQPGKTMCIQYRLLHKNGTWRWLESTITNLFHNPVIESLVFNFRDITKQVEGEEERQRYVLALEESEKKYKTLFESANDAIFLMTEDVFIDCNSRTEELFRCSRNEIIGCKPYEFSPEKQPDGKDSKAKALKYIQQALADKPQFFEWQHKTTDGSLFYAEVALNHVILEGTSMLQAIVRDISDRKRAEHITKMQYRIANAMVTARNLGDLFEIVRTELGSIIEANNFYIVFYDETTGLLTSPFGKDEKENTPHWPAEKSLTGKVIKEMKSLLIGRTAILKHAEDGEIILHGTCAESWLGVPLSIANIAKGAIVVQSYHDPNAYNQASIELMELIANQLSVYIDKINQEKELLAAKVKAEESDHLKTSFLNNMSHEIRTPLNGILGFTNLLTDTGISHEEREYYARIINQSSNQLLSIIDDIINISTIEAGQEKLNEAETDVNGLMKFLYDQFANKVDSEHVLLNYHSHVDPQAAIVFTDKTKLIQILSNLIGNAIKFTEKGMIEFQCQVREGKLLFYVEDSGIGIDPKYHELIFERFRQAATDRSREYGGNGLGLAISKAYVNLLGGEIRVESTPGQGARFSFTIAYKPVKPMVQKKETITGSVQNLKKATTILYAEDEYSNFILVDILLKYSNFEVMHVTTGRGAVEACRKNPAIDLVLMDLKMPDLNGFEATRIIKKERPGLPVIALTAYALGGDREKAIEAGCDDYISKPLKKETLMQSIMKLLQNA
ncbi:MAG: PAS domain S-box protein [Bacteroidales bacterium]|nr:PAS domain S-box protein [Bacteroidales bacterium]